MRPVRVVIPATGGADPVVVPLDVYQTGPVTLGLSDVDGVVDVDLEYTVDDVWDPDVTPSWISLVQTLTADAVHALVDADGNRIMATAVRATNAGVGTATLVVIQQGVQG